MQAVKASANPHQLIIMIGSPSSPVWLKAVGQKPDLVQGTNKIDSRIQ
jgi:hypothetical protein